MIKINKIIFLLIPLSLLSCTKKEEPILRVSVSKTINVVNAGTLRSQLTSDELKTVTKLTVTGNIYYSDFQVLRDNMPILDTLDISNVSIVAFSGYPANRIPESALINKMTLKYINLPNSINSIGKNAFTNCSELTYIIVPDNVDSIADYAFSDCKLVSISLGKSLKFLGENVFYCSNKTIKYILVHSQNQSFSVSENVLFNKSKTSIVKFPCGSELINYTIPNTTTSIGDWSFSYCEKITSITLPNNLKTIGFCSFVNCIGLSKITIPSSVTSIRSYAFSWCSGLTSIYSLSAIPVDLSSMNPVFDGINKTTCTLYVPIGSKSKYQVAAQWKDFVNIVEF
jgi:hypothetical protein